MQRRGVYPVGVLWVDRIVTIWDRCDVGRGVGEGGRVMAGQGQTKPCALAREESGMEGRERGGGSRGGGGGGASLRPGTLSTCLCNVM